MVTDTLSVTRSHHGRGHPPRRPDGPAWGRSSERDEQKEPVQLECPPSFGRLSSSLSDLGVEDRTVSEVEPSGGPDLEYSASLAGFSLP